jgi:hypothetical protein
MYEVILGFLVLCGYGAGAIAFAVWRATGYVAALVVLVGVLALAAWPLRVFWRRDAIAAAKLLLFCLVLPMLVAVLWAFNVPGSSAPWVAAGFAVPTVACCVYLFRELTRPEVLPNLLLRLGNRASICEVDGLQLIAQLVSTEDPIAPLALQIAVQSCVDAPRTLIVDLSGPGPSHLQFRPRATAPVGPGEMGVLLVPLRPIAGARAPGRLYLTPRAAGEAAPRVRYWEARVFERRAEPPLQAIAALAGVLVWGGGWWVNVPALGGATAPASELPPDQWHLKWKPEPALLEQARRR